MAKPKKATPLVDESSLAPSTPLSAPELFFNRELSWIEFNHRVLEEAQSDSHPLLERLKFLAIFSSNLDEFFMIRVSGLEEQLRAKINMPSIDGLLPQEQYRKIRQRVENMVLERNRCFYGDVLPKLEAEKIFFRKTADISEHNRHIVAKFFDDFIFPVLTPLALDPGHPFPHVSNLSLSLAVQLQSEDDQPRFARVKVPDTLSRLVRLEDLLGAETGDDEVNFLWLEDIISANIQKLFPNIEIEAVYPFRVIRDADIEIEEDEAGDLLEVIEQGLRQRRYGNVVRLDVNPGMPEYIRKVLIENLDVEERHVYTIEGTLGLASLMEVTRLERPDLKDTPFVPRNPFQNDEGDDIFSVIRKRDMLLHHPYDSYQPVIDLIHAAADDPDVMAIKMTLYRVGSKSPIIQALIEAAERGTQVAVLVELKARFDEENNIIWAKALEKAGVHVVYGLIGLKTHAKMMMIVRKEGVTMRRYIHLGTGNYNASTAKTYTDFSFFTSNSEIAADVSDLFNYLTGYSKHRDYKKLIVSPLNTRLKILELIDREITQHEAHQNGRIIFKLNQLTDPQIIRALYRASQSGVKVDLIIRGVCALRPQSEGISENVRVISVVGRFLEHSRVFYFHNNAQEEFYLGSADMMQRNLDRRVETIFPILADGNKKTLKQVLEAMLRDNIKSRELLANGLYVSTVPQNGKHIDSQLAFLTGKYRTM
jgi:polyphosphate kinase